MARLITFALLFTLMSPLVAIPKIVNLGLSAVAPGVGEITLGKSTRGAVMLTADLLCLSTLLQSVADARALERSFKDQARVYAGVQNAPDSRFWQDMQNYRSSAEFNQRQEMLARNYYLLYSVPNDWEAYETYMANNTYSADEAWDWADDRQWKNYRKTRSDYQEKRLMKNLFLGFMLFNRAISLIDVAFISSPNEDQRVFVSPSGTSGVMLNYQIGF